eukprot:5910133-Pyramimonas_sp.AAC.1
MRQPSSKRYVWPTPHIGGARVADREGFWDELNRKFDIWPCDIVCVDGNAALGSVQSQWVDNASPIEQEDT